MVRRQLPLTPRGRRIISEDLRHASMIISDPLSRSSRAQKSYSNWSIQWKKRFLRPYPKPPLRILRFPAEIFGAVSGIDGAFVEITRALRIPRTYETSG